MDLKKKTPQKLRGPVELSLVREDASRSSSGTLDR